MKNPSNDPFELARKNQILDAAAKLFAQKGFHNTTIRDIAKEARIADGTVYNYFENKTALLSGIFHRMRKLVEPDEAHLETLASSDLATFLKSFLQIPLNSLNQDDFQLLKVMNSEMMVNDELRTLYYEQILRPTLMLAEGYLEKWAQQHNITQLDIALTVRTISSLVMGLMMQNILGDETLRQKWDTLPDFLTRLLLCGLKQNQP